MGLQNSLAYVSTLDGVLNIFEVCVGCLLLYLFRTTPVAASPGVTEASAGVSTAGGLRHWLLELCAFSSTCNGTQLLLAAFLSPTTGYLMHHMLYYAVCLVTPAAAYGALAFVIVREEGAFSPVTVMGAIGSGLYLVHFLNVLTQSRSTNNYKLSL